MDERSGIRYWLADRQAFDGLIRGIEEANGSCGYYCERPDRIELARARPPGPVPSDFRLLRLFAERFEIKARPLGSAVHVVWLSDDAGMWGPEVPHLPLAFAEYREYALSDRQEKLRVKRYRSERDGEFERWSELR